MAQSANPQMVAQPAAPGTTAQPNVFNQSAQALSGAIDATNTGMSYQPVTVQAGQLGATNLQAYQNPYTQQVVDAATGDMNRARTMALRDLGAQATRAKAFGGSRHGVAEGETNRNFFDQVGIMSTGLRQQGFDRAQDMARFDIDNRMAADQYNANQNFAGAGLRLGAASQLAGLGQQGFNTGQQIIQQQLQQGTMQQALQQSLMDAARGQFTGFTGAPMQALQAMLASVGGANMGQQTQTTSKRPGLFDYLTLPFMVR